MLKSILPPNATPQERALELAIRERFAALPTPPADLWNPDTCPAPALPFLAWAASVDHWSEAWSESQRRAVIKAAPFVHRIKGTRAAVEQALAALGPRADIVEWWQASPRLTPGLFRVFIDFEGLPYDFGQVAEYLPVINDAKNVRSHLDKLTVGNSTTGSLYFSAFAEYLLTYDVLPMPNIYPEVEASYFMSASVQYAIDYTINPA